MAETATKEGPARADLAETDPSAMHVAFAKFLTQETGYKADAKTVQLVTTLRVPFRQSPIYHDEYKAGAAQRAEEAAAAKEAEKAEKAKAREAKRAEDKAAKDKAAAEKASAAESKGKTEATKAAEKSEKAPAKAAKGKAKAKAKGSPF